MSKWLVSYAWKRADKWYIRMSSLIKQPTALKRRHEASFSFLSCLIILMKDLAKLLLLVLVIMEQDFVTTRTHKINGKTYLVP